MPHGVNEMTCKTCDGRGWVPGPHGEDVAQDSIYHREICPTCKGQGSKTERRKIVQDILKRLEAMSEGEEKIEAEIVAWINHAVLKPYPPATDFGPQSHWQFWSADEKHFLGNESKFPIAPITRDMDYALAFVPEGWRVYAIQQMNYPGHMPQLWFAGLDSIPHSRAGSMTAKASTPALALTAASIRARLAM